MKPGFLISAVGTRSIIHSALFLVHEGEILSASVLRLGANYSPVSRKSDTEKSFGKHVVLLHPKYGENLDPRWRDLRSSSARPRL